MSSLGAARKWVYPARVKGRFQRVHRSVSAALVAVLLAAPWIPVGGQPALLIDLWARRLHVLGGTFTPRDTIFLVLLGLMGAFSLFFFTSLYGRLWCGYACPQTVFLEELIRPIEELIEGPRSQRMARDSGPLTLDRAWRKGVKWAAFAAVAGFLGMSLGSLFVRPLLLWTGQAPASAYAVIGAVSGALFLDFAWFREQFCNYLCPYARFQGALTDDESLVISYNRERGEPRGGKAAQRKRAEAGEDAGSCIDCKKCVTVCPQGIDIREGYQLECINCARCVDACTDVMGKLHQETLIRYTTITEEQGGKRKILRGRTLAYGGLLTGLAAAFLVLLLNQHAFDATVNRAPGTLYTVDDDGYIRNTFLLQVTNTSGAPGEPPVPFTVSVEGLADAEVIVPPLELAPDEMRLVPLVVRIPAAAVERRTIPLSVSIKTPSDEVLVETTFKSDARLEG